jgi:hypothetical protein
MAPLVQVTTLFAVTAPNHSTAHTQARRDAKEQARRDRLAAEEAERFLVSHFAIQTKPSHRLHTDA